MKNKNSIFIILTTLFSIVSAGTIIFAFPRLPPQVPLWYSLSWGERQLAPKYMLFLLPIMAMLFLIFNLIFPQFVKFSDEKEDDPRRKFLQSSFIFIAFSASLINLITIIKIVGLFL